MSFDIKETRSNIRGIGIDLEENKRIGDLIQKRGNLFLKRVFTEAEINYCREKKDNFASFTARFAAKEALLKALGTGLRDGFRWRDIELLNNDKGKPYFNFYGKVKQVNNDAKVHVSVSHTSTQAMAFVIIERDQNY